MILFALEPSLINLYQSGRSGNYLRIKTYFIVLNNFKTLT
jgi:hypothetical protein